MRTRAIIIVVGLILLGPSLEAGEEATLEEIKKAGAARSKYVATDSRPASKKAPKADLAGFRAEIEPILAGTCVECHGPEKQKGKFRIDTLDPDLVNGEDTAWWVEMMDVLSNGEMPPPDEDVAMTDTDRTKVIDWLSGQVLLASQVKRSEGGHSSFRRMTRYEFSYALQDLLGLAQDFSADLPPETVSEDGFRNSSEMLQMTSLQFATYRDIAREALNSATVRGARPEPVSFSITMDKAGPYYEKWVNGNIRELERELKNGLDPEVNIQLHQDIISDFEKARERMGQPAVREEEVGAVAGGEAEAPTS